MKKQVGYELVIREIQFDSSIGEYVPVSINYGNAIIEMDSEKFTVQGLCTLDFVDISYHKDILELEYKIFGKNEISVFNLEDIYFELPGIIACESKRNKTIYFFNFTSSKENPNQILRKINDFRGF